MKHYDMTKVVTALALMTLISFGAFLYIAEAKSPDPASQEKKETAEEMSIYGEVQEVNTASGSLTVQYYDYDSDTEKAMELLSDKETKLENAASLGEIKKGDWVDVAYIVINGKNISRSIIVEKEEEFAVSEEEMTAAGSDEE